MSGSVVSVREAYLDSEASLCAPLTVNESTLVFCVRAIFSRAQNWLDGHSLIAPDDEGRLVEDDPGRFGFHNLRHILHRFSSTARLIRKRYSLCRAIVMSK